MNKKNKIIIFSIFILICISLSIILLIIKKDKMNVTNKALNGLAVYVYDEDEGDYIADDEIPVGNYKLNTDLSYCKSNGEIGEYDSTNGTISYTFTSSDQCYLYFDFQIDKVLLSDNGFYITSGTNLNDGVAELYSKDTINLAEDDYDNIRFIGANPNNYVCFEDDSNPGNCINYTKGSDDNATGGLFRIIGLFNEDTHGQSGEQLVKLITADLLGVNLYLYWDEKIGSTSAATSSSITTEGSNDWSDSQFMYMLNGSEGNNKGYQSLTPVYGTTTPIRTLTYSNNNVYYNDTNYFYTNYAGYSYLSGSTTSSRTLNRPGRVANGSNYSSSSYDQFKVNSLVPSQTSMIKEVTWHLGGYSSSSILTSAFYTYERGSTVYGTNTTRPYTWMGKIGLMYPSDYGYATSGGTIYNRSSCLTSYNLISWESYSDCYTNDWLLYPGARTETQGPAKYQWTISPYSSDARLVFTVGSGGSVSNASAFNFYSYARPAFYLESEVYVTGGDGTSGDPYRISTTSSTLDNNTQENIMLANLTNGALTIYANIYSDNGISSFGLSSSSADEPTTWLTSDDNGTVSGTSYNLSYTASSAGTYYLWAKDTNGNTIVSSSSVTIIAAKSVCIVIADSIGQRNYFRIDGVDLNASDFHSGCYYEDYYVPVTESISFSCNYGYDSEERESDDPYYDDVIYLKMNGNILCNGRACDDYTISADNLVNNSEIVVNCPCLTPDTIVYYYDPKKKKLKKKKIKDVKYDDLLLCWDFDKGCFAFAKPLWIKKRQFTDKYNLIKFDDGSILKTVVDHRLFNKEKGMFTYSMSEDTPIGTTTFTAGGKNVKIVSRKVVYKETEYYNVITDYHINLFTNNILTSCRFSNLYPIENMKYVKDNHKSYTLNELKNIDEKWINGLRLLEQPIDINRNGTNRGNIEDFIKGIEPLDINNDLSKYNK